MVSRPGPGTVAGAYRAIREETSNTRTQDPGTSKSCIASNHMHSTRASKVNSTGAKQQVTAPD